MIHWEEGYNAAGGLVWHRYMESSHWGLFFTGEFPRWGIFAGMRRDDGSIVT
jgi:hypothetical protein